MAVLWQLNKVTCTEADAFHRMLDRRIACDHNHVALLAAMLSLGRMFADDYQDGTLEQLLLSACPLPLLVAAKIAAHWICSGLLLALVSPLLALQFDLGWPATGVLFLAFFFLANFV